MPLRVQERAASSHAAMHHPVLSWQGMPVALVARPTAGGVIARSDLLDLLLHRLERLDLLVHGLEPLDVLVGRFGLHILVGLFGRCRLACHRRLWWRLLYSLPCFLDISTEYRPLQADQMLIHYSRRPDVHSLHCDQDGPVGPVVPSG